MNLVLILLIGLATYLSRVLTLALLPAPPERIQRILNRVPAPLFAGLAALSLIGPQGDPAPLPILFSVAGALVTVRFRSLLVTLAGGLAGYGMAVWLAS